MLVGFYSGTSGIYYNDQRLQVATNNLANANTTSFIQDLMVLRTREENPKTKWIDPAAKKRMPTIYGVEREAVFKNFKPGKMQETGDPMDVALTAEVRNAFFPVKRPDPSDQEVYYSRNGNLSLGFLPGEVGGPTALYMGENLALGPDGEPILIDGLNGPLDISVDGTIRQRGIEVGQLPVFRFNKIPDPTNQAASNLQSLIQLGDSTFKVPPLLKEEFNPFQISLNQVGNRSLIMQGMLESSNVEILDGLFELMNSEKGASANLKSMEKQGETLTKLFQVVRS